MISTVDPMLETDPMHKKTSIGGDSQRNGTVFNSLVVQLLFY